LKEDLPGTFFKIKVSDEPGMLHEVTGEFKARHINISQIQITHDSEGMSELKIYCPSLKETVKGDLKRVLIELPGVASVTVSSL
jgi:acetolactate synthase small subunit